MYSRTSYFYQYCCDIWSLGTTMYSSVTNQILYNRPNIHDIFFLNFIKNGIQTNCSDKFNEMLSYMLEIDPINRKTLEELILDDWFQNFGN
jgi:serine/threonine protein kinase